MNRESVLIDIQIKRIFLLQFFAAVVLFLNSLADGIISSRFLGSEALSAIALYSPVLMFVGLMYVFIIGTNLMVCEKIGRGEVDKVRSLFSTCLVIISAIAFIMAVLFVLFSDSIARILGAGPDIERLLSEYIRGMAIGIPGTIVSGMLMTFLAVNNNMKLSYISVVISFAVNIVFNLLGVTIFPDNMFGIGLASSIAAYASVIVLLRGYQKKTDGTSIYFSRESICLGYIGQMVRLGSTKFFLTASMILSQYLINTAIIKHMGPDGTAVLAVLNTMSTLMSAITSSLVSAVLTLGSISYSQRDKESFTMLFKRALRFGLLITVPVGLIIVLFRGPISSAFFGRGNELWTSSCQMLICDAIFFQCNLILFVFLFMYRSRLKTTLVNILTVENQLGMAAFMIIALNAWTPGAAWLAFALNELATILILLIYAWIRNRKISLKPDVLLDLPDFEMSGYLSLLHMTLTSEQDACDVSKKIRDIGIENKLPKRIYNHIGLCLDELAMNILSMEFRKGVTPLIQIYLCMHDNDLYTYIWDNGVSFDTKAYIDQFVVNESDVSKNVGLRIIAKLADEMTYQNRFGLNFIIMRFSSVDGLENNQPGVNI